VLAAGVRFPREAIQRRLEATAAVSEVLVLQNHSAERRAPHPAFALEAAWGDPDPSDNCCHLSADADLSAELILLVGR
jgi:hypothetical protein